MVSMMAQRMGISAYAYLHAKTPAEVALDIEAWVASWAFPASMLVGGGGEGRGRGGSGSGRRRPGRDRASLEERYGLKLGRGRGTYRGAIVTDLDEIAKMPSQAAEAALVGSGLAKGRRIKRDDGKIVTVATSISPALAKPKPGEGPKITQLAHERFRGTG